MAKGRKPKLLLDRLLAHSERRLGPLPTQCWVWTGSHNSWGYGMIQTGSKTDSTRRMMTTHQAAATLVWKRKKPTRGHRWHHRCENRSCWRPSHIEIVTHRENVLMGTGTSAVNARRQRCKHDHPFDEANTIRTKKGNRQCRECKNAAERTRYWRRKAAA